MRCHEAKVGLPHHTVPKGRPPNNRLYRFRDHRLPYPARHNKKQVTRNYMRWNVGACPGNDLHECLFRYMSIVPNCVENVNDGVVCDNHSTIMKEGIREVRADVKAA